MQNVTLKKIEELLELANFMNTTNFHVEAVEQNCEIDFWDIV